VTKGRGGERTTPPVDRVWLREETTPFRRRHGRKGGRTCPLQKRDTPNEGEWDNQSYGGNEWDE